VKTKRKILVSIGGVLLVAALAALALPILTLRTNCGGNGYALTACDRYLLTVKMFVEENHSQFEINKLGASDKTNLVKLTQSGWLNGADFLIETNFNWSNDQQQIVIVCDREFGNIPRPAIWNFYHQNPAHAVGYSDGKVSLISPTEFAGLDLNRFIHLSQLLAANPPASSSK
jgi:hypothetical protein